MSACSHAAARPLPPIEYETPVPTEWHADSGPSLYMAAVTPSPTPTAVPTATPTPYVAPAPTGEVSAQAFDSGYEGQCGSYPEAVTRWWGEVIKYGWDPCIALYVISRESGGLNVYNYQGSGACGVMQLLPCQYPEDGPDNIAAGYRKYLAAGGWSPWSVMRG